MIVPAPVNFHISKKPWSITLDQDLSTDVSYSSPFIDRQKNDLAVGLQGKVMGEGLGNIRNYVNGFTKVNRFFNSGHRDFRVNQGVGDVVQDILTDHCNKQALQTGQNWIADFGSILRGSPNCMLQPSNPITPIPNTATAIGPETNTVYANSNATAQVINPANPTSVVSVVTNAQTTNPTALNNGGLNMSMAQNANSNVGIPLDTSGSGTSFSSSGTILPVKSLSDWLNGLSSFLTTKNLIIAGVLIGGYLYFSGSSGGSNEHIPHRGIK